MHKSKHYAAIAAVTAMMLAPAARGADPNAAPPAAPPFYAFCVVIGAPGVKPLPLADEAKLLQQLGFDGAGYPLWHGSELDKNLQVLDQARLKLFLVHTRIDLKNTAQPYDPRLPEAMKKLKGRPTTVCVLLAGLRPGDPQGMGPAVKVLRQLGDLAAQSGLRISVYHHVSDWTESLPFTLEVVKKVDHPQVGANFNLCHWLKVDRQRDYVPLLKAHAGKIFVVTLCGAQRDSEAWTNGLIQPLDRGDFDNPRLLATLREVGYEGPIGLMCYGVPGEPREHLARSIKTWKSWYGK
jgi:sugar phosphate isomerase/epimerase